MRAHFASDEITSVEERIEQQPEPALDERIDNFKKDTENMAVLTEFIDDVLQKAEAEASNQQNAKNDKSSQQAKEKTRQSFAIPDFKNGKVVNRARGFVVRIFDAICNCANTAAGPAQRIKLRGKRRASTQPGTNASTEEKPPTKEKAKKQENGKEKPNESNAPKVVEISKVEPVPVEEVK